MTSSFDCWHFSQHFGAGATSQPPAVATSTTVLDDLLPSASTEQMQHPESEEHIIGLSTEEASANKQPMQSQNKPLDPFMPSALPDLMLQHPSVQSSDVAAASFNQSGESLSLLDADMSQATEDPSAAMPPAATAAAAAAIDRAHTRSAQVSSGVHDATPVGSGTLSDDSANQDISLTTADPRPLSSPSQAPAVSHVTVAGDAQVDIQGVDHFAADNNHQSQLELQEACLPESSELDGSLPKSSTSLLPASEAVTRAAQITPDTSLVPSSVPHSPTAPAVLTAASEMLDQQATSAGTDCASIHSSSAKDQQEQQPQQQQHPASKDEGDAQVDVPKRDTLLKPHETAMAKAEEAERRLLTGDMAEAL